MKLRILVAALLVLTAQSGVRAEVIWEPVTHTASSSQSVTVDVDKSSIRQRDGLRQGWFRWNHMPPNRTIDGKEFASSVQLHMANCKHGELSLLQVTSYQLPDLAGEIIERIQQDRASAIKRFSEPSPESIGRTVRDALCQGTLK